MEGGNENHVDKSYDNHNDGTSLYFSCKSEFDNTHNQKESQHFSQDQILRNSMAKADERTECNREDNPESSGAIGLQSATENGVQETKEYLNVGLHAVKVAEGVDDTEQSVDHCNKMSRQTGVTRSRQGLDTAEPKTSQEQESGLLPSHGAAERLLFTEDRRCVQGKQKVYRKRSSSYVMNDMARPVADHWGSESTMYLGRNASQSTVSNVQSRSDVSRDSSPRKRELRNARSHNTSTYSEGPVCRICHEGDGSEVLISPCYCAGSLGLLHVSCLQKWLGSSNKTTCEICNFQFALERKTQPITEFFKKPGSPREKRNLWFDVIAFSLITPMTIVTIWMCLSGAVTYYHNSAWERSGLISLAICLITLYTIWITVMGRHNINLWRSWKVCHQEVTLVCQPQRSDKPAQEADGTSSNIHLHSIKINLTQPKVKRSRTSTHQSTRHQCVSSQGQSSQGQDPNDIGRTASGFTRKGSSFQNDQNAPDCTRLKQGARYPQSSPNLAREQHRNHNDQHSLTLGNEHGKYYNKGQGHTLNRWQQATANLGYDCHLEMKIGTQKARNSQLIQEYLEEQCQQARASTAEESGNPGTDHGHTKINKLQRNDEDPNSSRDMPGRFGQEAGISEENSRQSYMASWVSGSGNYIKNNNEEASAENSDSTGKRYRVSSDGSIAV